LFAFTCLMRCIWSLCKKILHVYS